MPASRILLLSADEASSAPIAAVLARAGHAVEGEVDPAVLAARVPEFHLVIIDVVQGARTAAEVCRTIREAPGNAAVPVLCVARSDEVEERIAFLEAGADDVMARPFDDRELEARVDSLLLRFQRSRELTPGRGSEALVLTQRSQRSAAVFSPKGGAGTTTIATNIAVLHARPRPDRVAILDLRLQFGQVATLLNLDVRQTLADLVRDEAAMREGEVLRSYTHRHESGLHVVAAPSTPLAAGGADTAQTGLIVETALTTFDSVVVDAGSVLDERTMAIFQRVDTIVLVVCPEISALKAVRSFVDSVAEAEGIAPKVTLVLNNVFGREILRLRDVESALGAKVAAELPYDPFLYLKAANEGVPVVIGAPKSAPAERLTQLSELVLGPVELRIRETAPEPGRKPRRLGLLRRS